LTASDAEGNIIAAAGFEISWATIDDATDEVAMTVKVSA